MDGCQTTCGLTSFGPNWAAHGWTPDGGRKAEKKKRQFVHEKVLGPTPREMLQSQAKG
jgi:hypothetical protein